MTFEPEWQLVEMCPSWVRWLPCSVHSLRIAPHPYRFPRDRWNDLADALQWDEPAWCDPGDPDEWAARAVEAHGGDDPGHAAAHAREHYDTRVSIRSERIELWRKMCQRAGIAAPLTLEQLLECLLAWGLYREETVDGESWLMPRLWQNPLEVLPFTMEEAAEEAISQQYDRALLTGAGLRRCAGDVRLPEDDVPAEEAGSLTVTASLREIGQHAEIPAGQVRAGLDLLASNQMVELPDIELDKLDLDTQQGFGLPWLHYAKTFHFEQLPAPEHMH